MPSERSRESSLWQWLKKAEPEFGINLHIERIENSAGLGTPDVHGCFRGTHFTIELKAVSRRPVIRCEIRPDQAWWADRRHNAGGNHWLLVQVGSASKARRYLVPGLFIRYLMSPVNEQDFVGLSVEKASDVINKVSLRR